MSQAFRCDCCKRFFDGTAPYSIEYTIYDSKTLFTKGRKVHAEWCEECNEMKKKKKKKED